ncbi:MAG: hypothetical protein NC834_01985 [Candidatus Omnitrophica bacterium]|nr:hypothetical protein [Candidatus Omnitrophota bacterium]
MEKKILGIVIVGIFLSVGSALALFFEELSSMSDFKNDNSLPVSVIKLNQEQSEQQYAFSYGQVNKNAGLEVRHLIIVEFITDFNKIVEPSHLITNYNSQSLVCAFRGNTKQNQ